MLRSARPRAPHAPGTTGLRSVLRHERRYSTLDPPSNKPDERGRNSGKRAPSSPRHWKEKLATRSEAVVRAEHSEFLSVSDLQGRSVRLAQEKQHRAQEKAKQSMEAASPSPAQTTLGQLVTQRPGRAEFFQSLGLDFCCGGGRTLEKACIDQRLDVSRVLEQLASFDETSSRVGAQPTSSPSNEDMSLWATPVLVSHILNTHHAYLKKNLPLLAQLAAKVERVHGAAHPKLYELRKCFDKMHHELDVHLWKEEQLLFPLATSAPVNEADADANIKARVKELAQEHAGQAPDRDPVLSVVQDIQRSYQSLESVLSSLKSEHIVTGQELASVRLLGDGFVVPPDGCTTYRRLMVGLAELESDLHLHIHKENNILFPRFRDLP